MKPENILFDGNFNLKIADFGFAAPIEGRDGSGLLKTRLGTESYMAPEIHLRKPYNGEAVDVFASGIILFIMFTQHPPFHKAIAEDPFFKLIVIGRFDVFWKAHSRNKENGEEFFPDSFKDLLEHMFCYNPEKRYKIADIAKHPWVTNGPIATL